MPALLLLLKLHIRGFFRRLFRQARTPKGIVLAVVGGLILFTWMGGTLASMAFNRRGMMGPESIEGVRATVPIAMLGFCLMTLLFSGGAKGITFTAAETDMLFPGPFSRWQLLLYRLGRTGLASIFGAVFFGMAMRRFSVSWAATYFASILMLLFLQVFTTAAALATQVVYERMSSRAFRAVAAAMILALAGVAYQMTPAPTPSTRPVSIQPLIDVAIRLRDSTVLQVLATPFKPFAYAMTAPDWPSLVLWTLASLVVLALTTMAALALDADYLEASATQSAKTHELMQKARKSGIVAGVTSAKYRLRVFPRLGGAGAVAWRQSLTALRATGVALLLVMVCTIIGAAALYGKGVNPAGPLGGLLAMITFVGGAAFRFDFRGDVDRLDGLKALPIHPVALCAGQLMTPMFILVSGQWLICALMAIYAPNRWEVALVVAMYAPLVSLLLMAIENLAFLVFPHRASNTPGDLVAIARNTLLTLGKLLSFAVVGGVGVGTWFLTNWLTGWKPLAHAAAWTVGLAACAAVLPLLATAFERLDVTAEAPKAG